MIFRHPHVFKNKKFKNMKEFKLWWENSKIKNHNSILEDIPVTLPALQEANKIQKKVASVGFEYKNDKEVIKKVYEELDELNNELDSDVIRYFFIMRGANSHLDFDLDLAKDESEKNPVYYLQYANARISNLLIRYEKEINKNPKIDLSKLVEKEELSLIKLLSNFPKKMEDVSESLEPRKLAKYLEEVAAGYHKFYGNCFIK